MNFFKFFKSPFNNIQLKIIALGLAFIIWYIVQGEEILEINKKIIVNIDTPEGYVISEDNTQIKDVTIKGPRVLIGPLIEKSLDTAIVIKKGRSGTLRYRIDRSYFPIIDHRVKFTVHDAYIQLNVEKKAVRTIKVKEFLKGTPANNLIIKKIKITPELVKVTGRQSLIAVLEKINTLNLDITGIEKTGTFKVKLDPPPGLKLENIEPSFVNVNIILDAQNKNVTFENIPIEVIGTEYISSIKPNVTTIVIQGKPTVLKKVNKNKLKAFVDAQNLKPGKKYRKEVKVKIPPNTSLIEVLPEKINLEVFFQKKNN